MDDDKVAVLVKRAALEFERSSNPLLAQHGLTGAQYRVLKYLYVMEGTPVRTVDIERHYSLTHPSTIGLLDALEKKGYVLRTPNPADARSRLVELTNKAIDEREDLFDLGDRLEREFTSSLSEAERLQLIDLLKRVLKDDSREGLAK